MKLAVEFPSVSYREGPAAVVRMAQAIERIGYDHIDIFDHVIMGIPIDGRPKGPYNPAMPILEALMTLSIIWRAGAGCFSASAWDGRSRSTTLSAKISAVAAPAWTRPSGSCERTGARPT